MRFALIIFLTLFVFSNSFSQVPGIKWQKTFGGTNYDDPSRYDSSVADHPKVFIPIKSGGYFIAGTTQSNNGDMIGNHGISDIWIARLDTARNIIWKNCYGGTSRETFGSIQQVGDDGFILIGSTYSNNGDVSGNHGQEDIWVVRLNMDGEILWQNCFGGTANDQGNYI
ncbi:MAG: hypothetical protein J7502_14185, partial [Flavisolibacter sp.]|nr:hypothetical protein [Flavisolibacter sp.]